MKADNSVRKIEWDYDEQMGAFVLFVDYQYVGPLFTPQFLKAVVHRPEFDEKEMIKDLIHVSTIPLQLTRVEREEAFERIRGALV